MKKQLIFLGVIVAGWFAYDRFLKKETAPAKDDVEEIEVTEEVVKSPAQPTDAQLEGTGGYKPTRTLDVTLDKIPINCVTSPCPA